MLLPYINQLLTLKMMTQKRKIRQPIVFPFNLSIHIGKLNAENFGRMHGIKK